MHMVSRRPLEYSLLVNLLDSLHLEFDVQSSESVRSLFPSAPEDGVERTPEKLNSAHDYEESTAWHKLLQSMC